ncbi:hypothetical protein CSAL01_07206 [Colletotrichum salicis]|uniref:Major facilitator superfamily (MFS) profile domain-containing protein n=1 Tax=Colletotrichum salicis TaxID=1209931 RepID=A0A135UKM7_9PEZI|nr:hypothetical protein CSAL01_07206 [Colletotrichum salicis]
MTKPAGPMDVDCRTARFDENTNVSHAASHDDTRTESNTKSLNGTASNEVSDSEELTYPEGGVEGWGVVLGSFCAMVSVFGLPNTSAVFSSYFSEHQLRAYTPSQIGWIFSTYLFVTYLFGILAGPIFDKYGRRISVAFGSIVTISSLVILSFCDSELQCNARIKETTTLTI